MPCRVDSNGNRITIAGTLDLPSYRRVLAAQHTLTTIKGYQDIVLDFAQCDAAYPGPMLGIASQAQAWRAHDIDIELVLPTSPQLARLFRNANWAMLIDPERHRKSTFQGYTHVPAAVFASATDQQKFVNRMLDALLCSLAGLERPDLAAVEWSLNEITDNVLVHANAPLGGIVQLNTFAKRHRVEFCVADAGLGIPTTLRQGFPDLNSDVRALEKAVREGVTRDPKIGQGNGLYGTLQVARTGRGYLHIHSGYARLMYDDDQLRISDEQIPFNGTLIVACLDCSGRVGLADALRFGGTRYEPLDYIETHFQAPGTEALVFRMHEEADSYGSRAAGEPIRIKLTNLIKMNAGHRIIIDLSEVHLVSSSFADEVFGKLFMSLGPLRFMSAIDLQGASSTVRALIDRAIMQRSTTHAV